MTEPKQYKCNHIIMREMRANGVKFRCARCGEESQFPDRIVLMEVKK